MNDLENKIKRRLFYIDKTKEILNRQVESKFFIQTTSTGLVGFLALFATVALSVISSADLIFKILIVIPIILAGFATYNLLKNIKYKKSYIGFGVKQIKENITKNYEDCLKLDLNSNIKSIEENEIDISALGEALDKSIKQLLWSIGILILLLIFSNFNFIDMADNQQDKTKEKTNITKIDEKNNKTAPIPIIPSPAIEDEKIITHGQESEDELFDVSKDTLMATVKESEENNPKKSENVEKKKKKN